jgi:flavin-dependent dehydrogenase
VVSFGIRRCEFDDYLLRRSTARLKCGEPIRSMRREGERWIVNDAVTAPMLVGAGGHFCPVARWLNEDLDRAAAAPLVVAQEAEFALDSRAASSFAVERGIPELYFCRDLRGYGWCLRKQNWLNIGFGRADRRSLPGATAEFIAFLERRKKIPPVRAWRWRGHAYLLNDAERRRVVDAGVLLVGDAAGLAYPQSGEGIRPAVESGLLAALTILDADGCYTPERLKAYEARLETQLGSGLHAGVSRVLPERMWAPFAGLLLRMPGFVRHVALDRWFLHADRPPLAAA